MANASEHNIATKKPLIGLVDADLLDNGTRHPNLVLLKLAGYFKRKGIDYELLYKDDVDLDKYDYVYLSQVFSFTTPPQFISEYKKKHPRTWQNKIKEGGTGSYANIKDNNKFVKQRETDMNQLQEDPFLPDFSMIHQMPKYDLYQDYIDNEVSNRVNLDIQKFKKNNGGLEPSAEEISGFDAKYRRKFKDYLDYSIGFLTRGCVRRCSFCVNKNERIVRPYSELCDFVDESRPYIYLWD